MGELINGNFGETPHVSAAPWISFAGNAAPALQDDKLESNVDTDIMLENMVLNFQTLLSPEQTYPEETFEQRETQRHAERQAIFGKITELTHGQLFGYVLRACNNDKDLTEDILQDTYLRAWRSLDKFRGDSKVSSWLTRIAINRVNTHYNVRHRIAAKTTDWLGTHIGDAEFSETAKNKFDEIPDASSEAAFSGVEIRHDLKKALARIAPIFRTVVILHEIQGMDHPQIAELLDIKEVVSRVRYHRALKKLRQILYPTMEQLDFTE